LNVAQVAGDEVVLPRRRYGQWIASAVMVVVVAVLLGHCTTTSCDGYADRRSVASGWS
jgi:hypothetical protein